MDPWQLLKDNRYVEAIEAYTDSLRERESSPNYCNRAIAQLSIGFLDRALLDFEAAERCRPPKLARGDAYQQWIGTVHWIAGAELKAAETWSQLVEALEAGDIGYTDAAGGVGSGALLWFAATWLDNTQLLTAARQWLERLVRSRRPST